jgi:hypothetical protein
MSVCPWRASSIQVAFRPALADRRASGTIVVVVEALEDRAVDQRTFNVLASVIFAVVALLHLLRIYMGWPIVIGSWTAPMWVSWIGLIVAGGLSYSGLSLATRS